MRRYELTDEAWQRIAPLLPRQKRGGKWHDHRTILRRAGAAASTGPCQRRRCGERQRSIGERASLILQRARLPFAITTERQAWTREPRYHPPSLRQRVRRDQSTTPGS